MPFKVYMLVESVNPPVIIVDPKSPPPPPEAIFMKLSAILRTLKKVLSPLLAPVLSLTPSTA
jgi:hypothetical protein